MLQPGVTPRGRTRNTNSPAHFLRAADWPGSAGCYPLAAVTMGVAVLGQLVVSVLAGGLVGGQGLRAGSVDSASHEHLLEVALGVLQRASSPYPLLRAARPRLMSASCSVGGKPLAQHIAVLTPPPHLNPHPHPPPHPATLHQPLSLSAWLQPLPCPPPSRMDNQISHSGPTKSSPP